LTYILSQYNQNQEINIRSITYDNEMKTIIIGSFNGDIYSLVKQNNLFENDSKFQHI